MDGHFGGVCDDFHFSTRLFLKLDFPTERETVLHFFERLEREFPRMSRLRRRDDGALVLEEDQPGMGPRRWVRLDRRTIRFGFFAPPSLDEIRRLGDVILEHAPYHLTLSPLDTDRLEVVYGFDLEYRGNHDQLVADALMSDHPFGAMLSSDDPDEENKFQAIECQPYFGMALTPACDLQAYFEIKGRTSTYEVRSQDYESQIISVYLTVRKYFGYTESRPLTQEQRELIDIADELGRNRVVPLIVAPLQHAIATRLQ